MSTFSWSGLELFYEVHLIAPGLDTYGVTLVGLPMPNNGFHNLPCEALAKQGQLQSRIVMCTKILILITLNNLLYLAS